MKNLISLLLLVSAFSAGAQQVPRQIVAEHFTNTWCSICGGRNPGFFANLAQSPDVLHLSIYPSAPYKGCPLSQYATAEQDARTNYYGVYGGTPRLVIGGKVLDAGADYTAPSIFADERGKLSSFELRVRLRRIDNRNGELQVVLYKRDTSSVDSLLLYGLLTQDTIEFAAKNGETRHYNVFRKAIWGKDPIQVATPAAAGDSVVRTAVFTIEADWDPRRIHATVLAQRRDRSIEQAARSGALSADAAGMNPGVQGPPLSCYPSPADRELFATTNDYIRLRIHDAVGRLMIDQTAIGSAGVDVSKLAPGIYVWNIETSSRSATGRFIKH